MRPAFIQVHEIEISVECVNPRTGVPKADQFVRTEEGRARSWVAVAHIVSIDEVREESSKCGEKATLRHVGDCLTHTEESPAEILALIDAEAAARRSA